MIYGLALAATSRSGPTLNGSLAYGPAALTLLILGVVHHRLHGRREVLGAALLFLVSLFARSIDLVLCAQWPYGTHFLWHLLNAGLLYLLVRAYQAATDDISPRTLAKP